MSAVRVLQVGVFVPSPLDRVDPVRLAEKAEEVRTSTDFALPRLRLFNSAPCEQHAHLEDPDPLCRQCGIKLRKHQRVGIMWFWLKQKCLLADPVGTGKALPLDAPVLTPTGFRRMGDLEVGDSVIDPEGKPSEVTGVFPQGRKQTYRITFSDGSTAESCEDHLWKVRNGSADRRKDGSPYWRVLKLSEIVHKMEHNRSASYRSFAVPLIADAPDLGPHPELVDPYLLGLLLGDGGLGGHSVSFTTVDDELAEAVEAALPAGLVLREDLSQRERPVSARQFRVSSGRAGQGLRQHLLNTPLRQLGLSGHRSETKFVPEQYKLTTAGARLAVLQGLLDTDGCAAPGAAEFDSCSRQLRDDVVWLARSLGWRASDNGDGAEHSYWNVQHQERRVARNRFRAWLVPPRGVDPFRLQRKNDAFSSGVRKNGLDGAVKWIRTVEPVRVEEHQCISVSADSRLFVTEDFTVTHNTAQVGGLFAILADQGPELGHDAQGRFHGRAIVTCEPGAMRQWQRELRRMVPSLVTELAEGTQQQRSDRYAAPWDVLIIGHHMLLRDSHLLLRLGITTLIIDDVDPLRHSATKTAGAIKKIGIENLRCRRIVLLNATPLQKRLKELYDTLSQLGLTGPGNVLGEERWFERRYLIKEPKTFVTGTGLQRKVRTTMTVAGHRNLDEFQSLIAPHVLRRTIEQIDDVELPAIQPEDVWLELHPRQRAKYAELQDGVVTLLAEQGASVKNVTALTKILYGRQICEGLSALGEPDGPGTSIKFDWLMDRLTGDWSGESESDPGEKVVVFVHYKDGVRALSHRMGAEGIGHVLIWGENRKPKLRDDALERFREDPSCRVLIGTSAIEKSLNLQVARHLVNVDTLPNPARMTQLSGRIRRQGSAFRTVYVHNLLTIDTHEERALAALHNEARLVSSVWGEDDALFRSIDPVRLLQLIAPSGSSRRPRTPRVRAS